MHGPPPSAAVQAAFGCAGPLEPLPGGRGTSWRAGDVVLKPLDMSPELLAWQSELLPRLGRHRTEFRVSVPLRACSGALVRDGWTAWRFEPGRHGAGAWRKTLGVGRALHAALRDEPAPPGLAERNDPWAVADRVAWGEADEAVASGTPYLDALVATRRPVSAPAQLIDADLAGNVLLADGLPPAVIDLSFAWRPAAYAEAIAVVDLVVDDRAPLELLDTEVPRQLLVRALLFRLVAEHLGGAHPTRVAGRFGTAVGRVLEAGEHASHQHQDGGVADAIEQTLPPVPAVVPADWISDNVAEVDEMNGETWETVTASGVREGEAIRIDFAFSAPTEEEAGDLAEYLVTSAQYEATAMPPRGEMDLWTVEGTTREATVTAAGIDEWVRRMLAAGWQHGESTLDGWSAVLG